jgi:hypothetical protein
MWRYHEMSGTLKICAAIVLVSCSAWAQQTALKDPLLDRMTGRWVLEGVIAGKETTHDIVAEWVLGHEYIQLHEVSREKQANGQAAYEAIVYIGWLQETNEYACLWLDSTGGGGLSAEAIGHAKRGGDEIAFLFKMKDDIFHTTFVYSRSTETWQWLMDNDEAGKRQPFARVRLTRKQPGR